MLNAKSGLHWSAFLVACWLAAFLGSYTYDACRRIYHALEHVTVAVGVPEQ